MGYRDASFFDRVFELFVTASLSHFKPSIGLEALYDAPAIHVYNMHMNLTQFHKKVCMSMYN